jgi:integrase
MGRKTGSRNTGFFFRKGRGWFTKRGSIFVPLLDEHGNRLRDARTQKAIVREAYLRTQPLDKPRISGVTLLDVCTAYLDKVAADGAEQTHSGRADALFDFCFGLPPVFRTRPNKVAPKPKPSDKIHSGYGGMAATALRWLDVDQWIAAHPKWAGCRRSQIQALKRALNYAVESGLIPVNPIKGYKTPKAKGRATYITPEQEAAMYQHASPALAEAIRVCIRTGARPGCEFAKLEARHVRDHGERMEWVFPPAESKTKTQRIIRIIDPEIIELVRGKLKRPSDRVFLNSRGKPWKRETISERFHALKQKLSTLGIDLDVDCCVYSCRHTYAKRTLEGFWSGRATNIEVLAKLMGNSPQVCRDHYLQWTESYTDPLWKAC